MRLLASLLPLALALPLAAQDLTTVRLGPRGSTPRHQRVQLDVQATPSTRRLGGYGWLTVELTNPDSREHTVRLHIQPARFWNRTRVHVTRTVKVGAGGGDLVHMPLPATGEQLALGITVDGNELRESDRPEFPSSIAGAVRAGVLILAEAGTIVPQLEAPIVRAAGGRTTRSRTSRRTSRRRRRTATARIGFVQREPAQLPSEWKLLSGFHLLVCDGAAPGWSVARQRTVAQYVAAGGGCLVANAGSLPDGSLRKLALGPRERDLVFRRHGFGTVFATRSVPSSGDSALKGWLADATEGPLRERAFSGPAPAQLFETLHIPGLGEVPVLAFFVVILGFAFLVGPVNFYWCQRRLRRPTLLLVTVPGVGIVFTGLILVYGLFSEGFGIKGAQYSVSWLDQRDRQAVTHVGRTLYAGLSPGELAVGAGTSLSSADLARGRRRFSSHELRIDLDRGGVVSGAVLPSRTPTNIVTSTLDATARARLRFRRRGDGGLDVLAGPNLRPLDEGTTVILRDFDGRYYAGSGTRLTRMRKDVEAELLKVCRNTGPVVRSRRFTNAAHGLVPWLRRKVGESLANGSYVALTATPPQGGSLGLTVEWLAERHLVYGRLAQEDVIE